jgi:hypothetical protein
VTSEGQDGDTTSTKDAGLSSVKNLEELGLDVTDTTLATDLVGQGVSDAVRDGLGVTRGTIAGLRDDKGEDVLNRMLSVVTASSILTHTWRNDPVRGLRG